ncbi:MAG: succinylglutamate desuccinylase/aspartoacylase family protein [Alphaproteobacteria bacterium]|nr:succinylglutamate desuccinylase/aspartoacylase family protein [Alphaproteobacteria bacterium]
MSSTRRVETVSLGDMIPGTRRSLRVLRYGEPGARPKAYLHAAIHASEMTGTLALMELADLLDAAAARGEMRGEVVLLPMCNPIGYGQFIFGEQAGRFDLLGRDNFNRGHFELSAPVAEAVAGRLGADATTNTALIRAAALDVLREIPAVNELTIWRKMLLSLAIDADIAFDIHSDLDAAVFMYVNGTDWPAARDVAATLGCAATILNEPYTPSANFSGVVGSLWPRLGERFGASHPIPMACLGVLLELRGRHAVSHEHACRDARNFLALLQRRGIVAGDPGPLPEAIAPATPVSGMDVGYAPFAGAAVYHARPGARVEAGSAICDVLDPLADTRATRKATLHARTSGVLYARPLDGMVVYPGQVMFRIAGATPLPHRLGRSWLDD